MSAILDAVCVFCGSSPGSTEVYRDGARAFGDELARRGSDLVWGGASVGLMGVVADAVLEHGRRAIGVIPSFMVERELAHRGASELVVVDSMHARKAAMAARADAFALLPGGMGSFEEFFEILTWAQLGLHQKPIGVLNLSGYFDPLLSLLRHAVEQGFMRPKSLELVAFADGPAALLNRLQDAAASSSSLPDALDKT